MGSLILPYTGPRVNKTMSDTLKRFLPDIIRTRVTYTGQKRGTKF